MTTIVLRNNMYQVQFPYDPMMVQMLKNNIPGAGRRWDHNNKLWQVDTQYEKVLRNLFPNDRVPTATQTQVKVETRIIELHYLGQCKERNPGEITAFGLLPNNEWGVIFPYQVLQMWFEGLSKQPMGPTLYSVLGTKYGSDTDEIKAGYRRMARQWHPDVCKEPNAHDIFLRIKEAYDILGNSKKKARYDAGLAFEASLGNKQQTNFQDSYRAPLRCGLVLAEGIESLGRFNISKILAWEDITNAQGQILVVSWPMGTDKPLKMWS